MRPWARIASRWLGLLVFLAAYAVPDSSYFHHDHHEAEAESTVAMAGPGEDAWHACAPPDHDCLACLWKSQRDSNDLLPGPLSVVPSGSAEAFASLPASSLLASRDGSSRARAPPSPA